MTAALCPETGRSLRYAYDDLKCRCDACRTANGERSRARREARGVNKGVRTFRHDAELVAARRARKSPEKPKPAPKPKPTPKPKVTPLPKANVLPTGPELDPKVVAWLDALAVAYDAAIALDPGYVVELARAGAKRAERTT